MSRRDYTLATLFLLADQVTKWLAVWLQPSGYLFELTRNTGASFGILPGHNLLLAGISIAALVLFWPPLTSSKGHEHLAWVTIYAGIMGNLVDRLVRGSVVDFAKIGTFPVFNVADACITLGVAYLLARAVREWFPAWRFKKGKLER